AHDGGDLQEPGDLCRAPAPLPGDKLIGAISGRADDHGLQDTLPSQRARELFELGLLEVLSGLFTIRVDPVDVDSEQLLPGPRRFRRLYRRPRWRLGYQTAQPSPQRLALHARGTPSPGPDMPPRPSTGCRRGKSASRGWAPRSSARFWAPRFGTPATR